MGTFKVKAPGLLTTVQDEGRFKYQNVGVCVSGVMDRFAHPVANMLVGNENTNQGVLEITMMGPSLEFNQPTIIAITGGNLTPSLNGQLIENWRSYKVAAGDVLAFGQIKSGVRAYLAIAGGIQVPIIMESKSTYEKAKIGGFEGRRLKAGDIVEFGEADISGTVRRRLPELFIPFYGKEHILRVVLGPQDDYFTPVGLKTFFSNGYSVSGEYDRMGYRLEGAEIQHNEQGSDIISDGMVMGAIQVPATGQPIILMADRQTAGGYTKIGAVVSVDLPKIAQSMQGSIFHFQNISVEEAQEIYISQQRTLEEIKSKLALA